MITATVPFDPAKVHGLRTVRGKALERLPFQLGPGQTAWTCCCGGGWLTIGPDEVAARTALAAHITGG